MYRNEILVLKPEEWFGHTTKMNNNKPIKRIWKAKTQEIKC